MQTVADYSPCRCCTPGAHGRQRVKTPPPVDVAAVLTEVIKYAAVALLAFVIGKISQWFAGYRKSTELVQEVATEMHALTKSVTDLRGGVEQRLDDLERQVESRFTSIEQVLHRFRNRMHTIVTRQEVRIGRLEERQRLFLLMQVGREKMEELETLMPSVSTTRDMPDFEGDGQDSMAESEGAG